MKNTSNLFVRLFVISLLTFRYFSVIVSLFGAGAATFFTAPAPAPAPTKMCRLRRLRLRIRLRIPDKYPAIFSFFSMKCSINVVNPHYPLGSLSVL